MERVVFPGVDENPICLYYGTFFARCAKIYKIATFAENRKKTSW